MEIVSRGEFLKKGTAFSLTAPGLLKNLFSGDPTQIILDRVGYNLPSVDPQKEAMAIREFNMLRGHSAVVVNPSLKMVNEFRAMGKMIIVRPYFQYNIYNPRKLEKFLGYPPGIIWLPFVEPNVPEDISEKDESGKCESKVVGQVVHDPEEIVTHHLVPFARTVLTRPGGEEDIILIPPTAQWASEDEFAYPDEMDRAVRKSRIPLKNLAVAGHNYVRKSRGFDYRQWDPWFMPTNLVRISTVNFEELLPFIVTEAGPVQDINSHFTEEEKAEVIGNTLTSKIVDSMLKKAMFGYVLWNQGYNRYAPLFMKDREECQNGVVSRFERAAIIGENGPTKSFDRIRSLSRRRDVEVKRLGRA